MAESSLIFDGVYSNHQVKQLYSAYHAYLVLPNYRLFFQSLCDNRNEPHRPRSAARLD